MTDYVLTGLVKRRADLAGEIHTQQVRLHDLSGSLAALDAVIRQFAPDYELSAIHPRFRRRARSADTTSISRSILDILRRAEVPMTAKAVAQAIMAERGLDQGNRALGQTMIKRVAMALRYQRGNGTVPSSGPANVWEVAR